MATRLVLLPYLQHWDGSHLKLNLLLLPRGNPLDPLTTNAPNFPKANFVFDVHLQPGLDTLPVPGGSPVLVTIKSPAQGNAFTMFNALSQQFQIDPSPPSAARPPGTLVKKHLPLSYQRAVSYAPGRTSLVFTDDTYSCVFKTPNPPFARLPPPRSTISWGKVIATLLRNSGLAIAAGLVRPFEITIALPSTLKNGGYIYFTLSPSSDASGLLVIPDGLKIYAARIPTLTAGRDLFSPVFFPVASSPPPLDYSEIFTEVGDYDDGWAKAVHCAQPQQLDPLKETPDGSRPAKELGIRLGWDDEQVTIWLNRQLDSFQTAFDSPLGVQGYRVDTRISGTTPWTSLVLATGPIEVNGLNLGTFKGDLGVEIHPVQLHGQTQGDFWLPTYFTAWSGPSLATLDSDRIRLAGGPDQTTLNKVKGVTPQVSLTYGKTYEFRVRLMDHTSGGPQISGSPFNPGLSPIGSIHFRRWIRPLAPTIADGPPVTPDPTKPPASLKLLRPLLHHPSVVCTGFYHDPISLLVADLKNAIAQGREVGLPDPDVTRVQITIEVNALTQDPAATDGTFMPIATTTRQFPVDPAQPLVVDVKWTDISDVSTLVEPGDGALLLPTARTVRLRIVALCRDDVGLEYFGAQDVRVGPAKQVTLRKDSSDEQGLFTLGLPTQPFSAFFFQPDPPIDVTFLFAQHALGQANQRPADIATRAAAAFGLRNDGLTLRAMPGQRVVFGCASSLRHTIGPDGASITFSSKSDLTLHWIIMIPLVMNRDWSWDGLVYDGIEISRDGNQVGRFSPTRNVNNDALSSPKRTQTDLFFFDAIEAKPAAGTFPAELNPKYIINVSLMGQPTPDPPLELTIRLPVTTPPTQIPQITSAGIAMSPYVRAGDYSETEIRKRVLWIELAAPVSDKNDRFFARVLRNTPDPILSSLGETVADTPEPQLAIDSEAVRKIVRGQADDRAGVNAMQLLIPSDSPLHWALPIPPGLSDDSPEMFGFFTYELRVGHFDVWSTAQGRFGPPLRVAGVQHPPPPLRCTVVRTRIGISVSTPYAFPVLDGVPRNIPPRSRIWVMLYVQAEQIDGNDRRNILLTRMMVSYDRSTMSSPSIIYGEVTFPAAVVAPLLQLLGFPPAAPLSVLAVELLPQDIPPADPLGSDLGGQRILRTSTLTKVPAIC